MADDVNNLLLQVDAQVELARRNLHSLEKEVGSFQRNTEKHLKRVDSNFDKVSATVGKFKTALAGLGVSIGFAAISAAAKSALDFADDLATAADQTNISVERFQTLRGAFRSLEVDAGTFEKILQKLITAQGDVASGAENTATKALDKLGVSAKILNGEITTTDQLIDALARSLGDIDSPAKRASIAADIVSAKFGTQLAAALGDGGKALKQAEQDFRDTGKVIDAEMIAKLAAANEKWDAFTEAVQSKSVILAADVLTAFEAIGNAAGRLWDKYWQKQANFVLNNDWLYDDKTLQGAQDELIRQNRKTIDAMAADIKRQQAKLSSVSLSGLDWINPQPKAKINPDPAKSSRTTAKEAKRVFTPNELRQGLDLPPVELPISLDADAALVDLDALRVDADGLKQTVQDLNGVLFETFDAELQQRLEDIGEAFENDLSRTLADTIVYGDDLGDSLESAFKRAASAMLEAIIQAQILGPLLDKMGKGGGGGGLFGKLLKFGSSFLSSGSQLDTSFTSGLGDKVNDYTSAFGRASGGPVNANQPYWVGEREPELIVPRMASTVFPLSKMGGGQTINVSVDARGATDPAMVAAAARRAVYEAAPAIVAASTKNTMDRANRRQLPRGLG